MCTAGVIVYLAVILMIVVRECRGDQGGVYGGLPNLFGIVLSPLWPLAVVVLIVAGLVLLVRDGPTKLWKEWKAGDFD